MPPFCGGAWPSYHPPHGRWGGRGTAAFRQSTSHGRVGKAVGPAERPCLPELPDALVPSGQNLLPQSAIPAERNFGYSLRYLPRGLTTCASARALILVARFRHAGPLRRRCVRGG